VGDAQASTIVCGAPNVAGGQTVAVARPARGSRTDGSSRPELRGYLSEGMILAEDELALGQDHTGTMVLADGVARARRSARSCRSVTT